MSLKRIDEATVVSSEGFKVKYSRDTLIYVEDDRRLAAHVEHLMQPYEMVVSLPAVPRWIVAILGALGAYDNFRNHEFREGLPHRSSRSGELLLHATRQAFYLVLFPTMAWLEWRGWLALLFGATLLAEIAVTCADFVEEDRTRALSVNVCSTPC